MAIYSDIDDKLEIDGLIYDESAVAQAIRNLLLTTPGEHIFNPTFGCDLDLQLFDPLDDVWEAQTRHIIYTCLSREPRVIVRSVTFEPDYDHSFVKVILIVSIRGFNENNQYTLEITP